jgi:hypothetical protein
VAIAEAVDHFILSLVNIPLRSIEVNNTLLKIIILSGSFKFVFS